MSRIGFRTGGPEWTVADGKFSVGLVATDADDETVEDTHGRLPLLAPMSEIAGKLSTQAGAFMLERVKE